MPCVIIENSDMPPIPGQDVERHEHHAEHGHLLSRLFWLILMTPIVASIRKLILSKRKAVWLFSDSMSRRICWVSSTLRRRQDLAAHQERQGPLGVQDIVADAPVEVFLLGDVGEDRRRLVIADVLAQDLAADLAERGIDVFQRVRRIFDIGAIQIEQQVLAVGDIVRLGQWPGAAAGGRPGVPHCAPRTGCPHAG